LGFYFFNFVGKKMVKFFIFFVWALFFNVEVCLSSPLIAIKKQMISKSYANNANRSGVRAKKSKSAGRSHKLKTGKRPRNYRYAGKSIPVSKFSKKLAIKYNKPIRFNRNGYPDFSSYSKEEVKSTKLTGINWKDIKIADGIMKSKSPGWVRRSGWTWHHHQNKKTMQLMPSDLHAAIPHSGGASLLKQIH